MNCKEALPMIHDYLDERPSAASSVELKKHLIACPECRERFNQLERIEALVKLLPRPVASDDLTERVMNSLPKGKKKSFGMLWLRRHPAISVASVFFFIMMGSFLSLWNQDTDLVVKGSDLDQLQIVGSTVLVPKGKTIEGDLIIQKGVIQVEGEIKGNLIVIDGTYNLASTAHISGKIKQVDQILDWLWFKANRTVELIAK